MLLRLVQLLLVLRDPELVEALPATRDAIQHPHSETMC